MPKLPTVAIIIPAYNEEETIGRCLATCIDQTSLPDEIIVVDNNSTDRTVEIVEAFMHDNPTSPIHLFHEKVQGITPARDRGFKEAKSEILGRIDSDSIISRGWVEAVRNTFSDPKVAAASGPVQYHDMPLTSLGLKIDEKIRSTLSRIAKDHRFLFGSNMAIRSSVWKQVRHLTAPAELDGEVHEDIDLALVLFENNFEVVYDKCMEGGMSARRLEDSPKDFYRYVMKFEHTFKRHNVQSRAARIPIIIYLLAYFPTRTIRKFYDGDTNKFTLQKLKDELSNLRDRI
jgi:glycosyltransferase involved in cell wall biosynthesis